MSVKIAVKADMQEALVQGDGVYECVRETVEPETKPTNTTAGMLQLKLLCNSSAIPRSVQNKIKEKVSFLALVPLILCISTIM